MVQHKHPIHTNSTYDYYNADLIKTTKLNQEQLHELNQVREEVKIKWHDIKTVKYEILNISEYVSMEMQ